MPAAKKESAFGLDLYIRSLYQSVPFPSVDEYGLVYLNTKIGATGRDAMNRREYLDPSSLKKHLSLYFPQGGIHNVTAPESRALQHKPYG